MCGIAGFIQLQAFDADVALTGMAGRLRHRGPDDEGFFKDPDAGVYLSHRRLSIIDTSPAGRQPLANEDGRIQAVVNGEFYNFQPLRRDLIARGHHFRSHSDSEILVHGYEEWGESVVEKIEGIFAFALWDDNGRCLLLGRDPLGVKPLVYMHNPTGFFFSSEAQAFHALPRNVFRPAFDRDALHQLICFQYIYDPERTAYDGVKRLLPGSLLRFRNGKSERKRYWSLQRTNLSAETMDISEAASAVETALREAVQSQLVSDVPVGILLSGGLDSSVVAALAQEGRSEPIRTFTAGFSHALDERSYARDVAVHIGSRHQEFMVDPAQINDRLEELVPKLDDLTSLDGGMFTTHLLSEQIARFGVKVLLVGEGSDEIFGGYSWYGLSRFPFHLLGAPLRSALFYYCISRMLPSGMNRRHFIEINRIMANFDHDDIFRTISAFEITRQLPNHFLMKVDHGTMSLGLEARVPFLDRKLTELVFNLAGRVKLKGRSFSLRRGHEKWVLREMARKILPADIAGRQKRGFSIPMPEVLKSNAGKMQDMLLSGDSVARSFFGLRSSKRLMNFKNTMYSPLHKHREFLCWRLLLIEIWRRHYGVSM